MFQDEKSSTKTAKFMSLESFYTYTVYIIILLFFFQQTLYEFAFYVGDLNDDFAIETMIPRRIIPCSSVKTLVQCGIECCCLLTVSYSCDGVILQSLSEVLQTFHFST